MALDANHVAALREALGQRPDALKALKKSQHSADLVSEQHMEALYGGMYPDAAMPYMPPKVFAKSYDEVISERKEREWPYVRMSALQEAINSTLCDTTMADKAKADKIRDSVLQFLKDAEVRKPSSVRGDS